MYYFRKDVQLVSKQANNFGEAWEEYVGQAENFTEACELAAQDHEKTTGIKGACISVQVV